MRRLISPISSMKIGRGFLDFNDLLLRALPDLGYVSAKHLYESGDIRQNPTNLAPVGTGFLSFGLSLTGMLCLFGLELWPLRLLAYTYVLGPSITSITPDRGPTTGGTAGLASAEPTMYASAAATTRRSGTGSSRCAAGFADYPRIILRAWCAMRHADAFTASPPALPNRGCRRSGSRSAARRVPGRRACRGLIPRGSRACRARN